MAVQPRESYQLYKRYVKNIAVIYNSRKDIRAYIELMLSISVIVVFGIFALRPTFVTIAELQKEIKQKEETLAQLNQKITNLDIAQRLINENRRTLSLLDTSVPDGPLPVLYARQIEGLTRRHSTELFGLGTEKVTILGQTTATTIVDDEGTTIDRYPATSKSMEFNVSVRGDYLSLRSFVADIEKLRRPILIDKLAFNIDDGSNIGEIILSIVGRVPFVNN